MASLYSTNAAASSDPHGSIRSEDGLLDLKLARPCVLCGRDDATNPEQLFAGGYAACFENALLYVTWDAGRRSSDDDIDVVAALIEVGQEASCWSPRLQRPSPAPTNAPLNGLCRVFMPSAGLECDPGQYQCGDLRLGRALSSSSSEESHENNRDNEMKNWDTRKTSLAERLADGRRYASGKTAEAVDLSNFLQAVIRSGDRVCLEGDNQKQADVLAAALADIDPAKVHDLHMIQYAAAEL